LCGCATLPPFEFSAVHKFLAGGNGDSQLWQVRFTTQSPRFTTWFTTFGRAMARISDLAAEITILTAVRGALALVLSSLPCCFFLGAHRFGRTALVSRVGGCGTPVGSSGGICVYFGQNAVLCCRERNLLFFFFMSRRHRCRCHHHHRHPPPPVSASWTAEPCGAGLGFSPHAAPQST